VPREQRGPARCGQFLLGAKAVTEWINRRRPQSRRRVTALWLLGGLASGVASTLSTSVPAQSSAPSGPKYVLIGEGFTAAQRGGGLDAGFRRFTTPEAEAICDKPYPENLVSRDPAVHIELGARLPYSDISISALDSSGAVIPRFPVWIEVEETTPPIIATWPTSLVSEENGLLAQNPGRARIRVHAFCDPGGNPVPILELVAVVER